MTGESEKPFLSVKRQGLKLSKATSLLTTASKRDGVRSSAGGSDTVTGRKKNTPRRETDLITPKTTRRHDDSTLSHLRCYPSVKDLELSARSRRL